MEAGFEETVDPFKTAQWGDEKPKVERVRSGRFVRAQSDKGVVKVEMTNPI
jgi:hypothetical protein